ncbi:hypothetical protein B0J13DRAFT_620170 [Dactylonectria estremocensis]|uniref:Zn(2)-C6 fungal-type domain-containing protein n=1 Tax=Dactylonectria estremocensis TaxID=1079267 RepID=A0A9P9F0X0_9HYPO|nr:hypothetical protein B0J13DRAFT_620170 [Dactylonectria estremocensis]
MVNYGQPSKNCLPCRRRKLRCDLQAGGCTQCCRAKLTCHGYRDRNELAFRDETRTTRQKAVARQASALPRPTAAPQLTWYVQSRNAFLCLYVDGLSCSFDALAPLMVESPAGGYLHACVDAASLAFMAFRLNRPDMMVFANRRYLAAIQSLGMALRSSEQPARDDTLQSVLLLDVYEKIAGRHAEGPGSLGSWLSHVQGALSMVRSRPSTDFSNQTTCQLASRTAVTLAISCGVAGVSVPETLRVLCRDLDCYVRGVEWAFTSVLVGIVDLRADIRNLTSTSTDILRRARELDDKLVLVKSSMSRSWRSRRVYTAGYDPVVFGGYYDVYPSHHATQVSNAIFMMRLEMSSIIRTLDPDERCNPYSPASKTITELTRGICAAIPQFLLPEARTENAMPFSPLQLLRCNTMLYPLYAAAQLTTDPLMRDWILQSLARMAENGLKMARDVADMVTFTPEVDLWAVYAMVGCYAIAA